MDAGRLASVLISGPLIFSSDPNLYLQTSRSGSRLRHWFWRSFSITRFTAG
jgi:hypothetical protein